MNFVDRVAEMRRLDALLHRGSGGIAFLWGRRRIGKTRLLLEWSHKHAGLYSVADESAQPVQRRYFAEAVASRFPGFAEVAYPDWRSLLRGLSRAAAGASWRGPIVLDEFPYLVASCPALPSVFQNWVDHEAKEARLVVVLAGSTQHMMQGLALEAASPLYGRAVEAIGMRPMRPGYIQEALRIRAADDAVRTYAVWGGIPQYWELAEPYGADLDGAVQEIVLDPMGPLHLEPDRLLREEMPPALSLRPILDAIGMGAHRVSEIAGRLGQPATSLSRPLTRLVELGLIRREQPYGEGGRSGKRSLYKIEDPFFRFWFRVVAPHRAALAESPRSLRTQVWKKARTALFAETWESLCRESIPILSRAAGALGHLGPWGPAGRFWRGKGPEWDIVSHSLDGKALLLAEVKWHERSANEDLVDHAFGDLVRKGVPELPGLRDVRIVHAVFLPTFLPKVRLMSFQGPVVDCDEVLAALR